MATILREGTVNIFITLGAAMFFVYTITNWGEHPGYRPGLKPAVVTGVLGLVVLFAWDAWMIGK